MRSCTTSGATKSSVISAASVPGRGENTNVYAASYVGLVGDLERALEVGVGLAREPDDDVGRDREVGNRGPGRAQPFEVARRGVAAVHARQRVVAARLQRQVQVLAHVRALGHRRDRLGAQILGVRRREADALDAVDRVERAQADRRTAAGTARHRDRDRTS